MRHVTQEVANELARLGYHVGSDEVYTIDGKEGTYALVGIQETATQNGVKIWCLMRGGDLADGVYCVPIGRVDKVKASAAA